MGWVDAKRAYRILPNRKTPTDQQGSVGVAVMVRSYPDQRKIHHMCIGKSCGVRSKHWHGCSVHQPHIWRMWFCRCRSHGAVTQRTAFPATVHFGCAAAVDCRPCCDPDGSSAPRFSPRIRLTSIGCNACLSYAILKQNIVRYTGQLLLAGNRSERNETKRTQKD